ncbi:MAG: hypothetical protein A2252_08355 [Elusimicrobia bacterium RIFOXYA2_FULL_39_19]|nr:MAG: hypothetical protein A2252_08355 [Elusimicrobia bacterium RIFOXYA2_FULL_39_19]
MIYPKTDNEAKKPIHELLDLVRTKIIVLKTMKMIIKILVVRFNLLFKKNCAKKKMIEDARYCPVEL